MNKAIWIIYFLSFSATSSACMENYINNIEVLKESNASVEIQFRYCYEHIYDKVKVFAIFMNKEKSFIRSFSPIPLPDSEGTITLEIPRPELEISAFTTTNIRIYMYEEINFPFQNKKFHFEKDWPTIALIHYSDEDLQRFYHEIVTLIDSGNNQNLTRAKGLLDAILKAKPDFVDAYHELARYYMTTKGFGIKSRGVLLAEQSLLSALEIDQNHADTHVLLGYVYTWEQRYAEALIEFQKAEKFGTDDTWLYTNWGQMYEHQGELDKAIIYYKKAAQEERKYNTYDRAITQASNYLYDAYIKKHKFSAARKLAALSADKFPERKCYRAKENFVNAIYLNNYKKVLTKIKYDNDLGCKSIYKNLITLANLRLWLDSQKEDVKASRNYYLRAINATPDYVELLVNLSNFEFSDQLLPLLKNKRGLEVRNENDNTALTRAILYSNAVSVERLLEAGSKIDITISNELLTPLMLAVLVRSEDKVKLLLNANADASKMSIQGVTALGIAKIYKLYDIEKLLQSNSDI